MANYPIPPWLTVSPTDFGQAASRGAEIQVARSRIAQEAQQANVRASLAAAELAARREEDDRRAEREATQLEYQKAYHATQLGLREQEMDRLAQQFEREQAQREFYQGSQLGFEGERLGQSGAELEMKLKTSAEKSQAVQEAQDRIRSGEDPAKVWMELGPKIGATGNAMATLARKPPELGKVTPITLTDGRKVDIIQTGQGSIRVMPPSPMSVTNLQSVPVLGPNGQEIPGIIGIPGPTGVRPHNIPRETGAGSLARTIEQRRIALGKTNAPPAAAAPTAKPAAKPAGKLKPTEAAIQHLIENPELADQFDLKYGKGEAERILKSVPVPVYDQEE